MGAPRGVDGTPLRYLQVHLSSTHGGYLTLDIALKIEGGEIVVVGRENIDLPEGIRGFPLATAAVTWQAAESCDFCGKPLSRSYPPDRYEIAVKVRHVDAPPERWDTAQPRLACHRCLLDALESPGQRIGGMPLSFEARTDVEALRSPDDVAAQ